MKHILTFYLFVLTMLASAQQRFQTIYSADSLKGFNESACISEAAKAKMFGKELQFYLSRSKRNFINTKYAIIPQTANSLNFRPNSNSNNQIMAACTNMDFEAGNLNGWNQGNGTNSNSNTMAGCCPSAGGNAVLISGGTDALTGVNLNSPFGGNFVCRVNDQSTGGYTDRISQTFNVTPANSLVQFAYLAVLQSAGHGCPDQPYMNISLLDCNNNVLPCPQVDIQEGNGCGTAAGFVPGNGFSYTNAWQVSALDLTPYIGNCITIRVTAGACTAGGHWGYGYFDAKCSPMDITVNNVAFPVGTNATTVTLCGASIATVSAPPGLGPYLWNGPAGSGVTNVANQTFTTTTAGLYTITMNPVGSCAPIIRHVFLQVSMPPLAGFNFTNTACVTTINCVSTSSLNTGPPITNIQWTWGDASANSSGSPAAHTYTASGPKTVKLVVTNSNGCKDSVTHLVNISQKPTANFTISPVCHNVVSNFTNTSTTPSGTNSYTWDYGNASPLSNATSPSYTYPSPGNYTVNLVITNTDGCKDSIKKNLSIYALPLANFTLNYVPCGSTSFTATSTSSLNGGSPISNYVYTWNDATPNSLLNPAPHTYTASGPKQIKLLITNVNGCKDSITKTITIAQKPTANFTVNPICLGASNNFNNSSTTPSGTNSYTWDFGNASALNNSTNPSYTYPASGNYTTTLIITNTDNCTDSIKKQVSVYGRAVPDFSPTDVCFNSVTNFTNSTSTSVNANTGVISTYSWTFGNGGTSALQSPVYTYTNPSNQSANTVYSVSLYVTTINGCKDSITKPVTVYSLPTPSFTADSVCFGSPTTLTDLSNTNGNGLFLFSWDFNNDNVADLSNNLLTSTNTFTNWGNTLVTYTVFTSPNGGLLTCKDKVTKNVWVHPIPVAVITHTNRCIDLQPNLMSGVNSTIAIGSIANYAWNYGNGNSNLVNPLAPSSFSYNLAGNYVVSLTVTSVAGCTNSASQATEVWERPFANFSYSKTCAGKKMILKGNQLPISAPITAYEWDFNSSIPTIEANGAQVSYTFNTAGLQPVNLLITSNQGCKNTVPGNIYVNYNPKPNFYAPKRAGCADLCIAILDSTQALTGPAKNASWEWDLGNGNYYEASNGNLNTICYRNESNTVVKNYTLKLVLRTDSGCVDSLIRTNYVTVYPNPLADFEWKGVSGDILTPKIEFTNTSIGYSAFAWYYNDGVNVTDSTKDNPVHYYNTDLPRNFNVFLAVRNQYGCKDTTSKYVEIGPEYTFYIPNTFTPNEDGTNELFTGYGIGVKGFKMWIYDRWGEKLYYTEDMAKGWDGTIKGKQGQEKMDVYTYKAIVTDLWNKQHEYVGHVTLLR